MRPTVLVFCAALMVTGVWVGPASAELSVYQILNESLFAPPGVTPETWVWDDAGSTDGRGIQTWRTTTGHGEITLVKEDSVWANSTSFGFYDVTTREKTEIFADTDPEGTVKTYSGNLPYSHWGFYVDTPGYDYDWYSEHHLNNDEYAHERVATYLDGTTNWFALFWEDTEFADPATYWYGGREDTADPPHDWKNAYFIEPDHNDVAVKIRLTGGHGEGPTPELPSGALLLLSSILVGLVWWRRRKVA